MRGAKHPDETGTVKRIKIQFGTIRTLDSQKDVARFARDLFRLAGQVISKHLDPANISAMTGLPELPQPIQEPQPPAPMLGIPGMAASAPGMPPMAAGAPPAGAGGTPAARGPPGPNAPPAPGA